MIWAYVGGALVVLALVSYLWKTAVRIDRLHISVLKTRAVLDKQLVARASAASQLASSGLLDPATSVILADCADKALSLSQEALVLDGLDDASGARRGQRRLGGRREQAESHLSITLRAALAQGAESSGQVDDNQRQRIYEKLDEAWARVVISRKIHNVEVERVNELRARPLVRTFKLWGRARRPQSFEIDDSRGQWLGENQGR